LDISFGGFVIGGGSQTLFYGVPEKYESYICTQNADHILVGLLPIAKKQNENIQFEGQVVDQALTENIQKHLVPAFNQMGLGTETAINISPLNYQSDCQKNRKAATGISLGVDSFYSIKKIQESENDAVLLTFLYSKSVDDTMEILDSFEFNRKISCAKQMELELIPIISNIRSILEKEFAFEQIHTFCHLSYAMFLRGGIEKYYYASGYKDADFMLSLKDSSCYDRIIAQTIHYPGFTMISSGSDISRTQKTDYIKNDKAIQQNLSVCLTPNYENEAKAVNCSQCGKCIRTMTTLDVFGALDSFSNQFDTEYYIKNKSKCWGDVLYRKVVMHDPLAKEILEEASARMYKLPIGTYYHFVKKGVVNQMSSLNLGKLAGLSDKSVGTKKKTL